jgi:hypothetical protein
MDHTRLHEEEEEKKESVQFQLSINLATSMLVLQIFKTFLHIPFVAPLQKTFDKPHCSLVWKQIRIQVLDPRMEIDMAQELGLSILMLLWTHPQNSLLNLISSFGSF